MKWLGRLLLLTLLSTVGACACAGDSGAQAEAAAKKEAAAHRPAAAAQGEEPAEHAPAPEVAAPDPLAGITGDASLAFLGEAELLVANTGDFAVSAFDAVCLTDVYALSHPARVDARLENLAEDQGVALGRLRFVRFETPPRALAPMRPRLCRPVASDAALAAPLFRAREVAARWLLTPSDVDSADQVGSLVDAAPGPLIGVPRVVVVRGIPVAVALPLKP